MTTILVSDPAKIAEILVAEDVSSGSKSEVWLWWAAILVLIMHLGFAFLEAGSVQQKNALNVMFKNIMTITIGGVCYYFAGYSLFSAGTSTFAGSGNELLLNEVGFADSDDVYGAFGAEFFFQFAFAATAATIVSGAVAGRITLPAYGCAVVWITLFQYPIVTHWVWASTGWLTAFHGCDSDDGCALGNAPVVEGSIGLSDFAGSGVVHMSGGFSALAAIIVLGARDDAMVDGKLVPPAPSSETLMAIGVFVLWIGWYGFNCGSTLTIEGYAAGMGHAAMCTTLAPSAAIVTAMLISRFTKGYYDLPMMLNSALGGLVGITASAQNMEFGMTMLIGAVSTLVYIGSSKLLIRLGLDDPVGAIAVHGFCGIWGVLAASFAATHAENFGAQFAQQLLGVVAIGAWNFCLTFILFAIMALGGIRDNEKKEKFLRATAEMQKAGLDDSEHGGEIYKSF